MKQKIIVVLGQTATGKTALAVKIAKKYNGEVVSADSRQVYKMLDIGTGKITKKEQRGVPHYLLDVVNPKKKFTVTEYQNLAEKKIKEILARGSIPIVCGGTGFYIDAITKGIIFPLVPPNKKLRKSLEKKTTQQLFKLLRHFDPARAKNIDSKNKIRMIRAIEIAKALGKVPKLKVIKPKYDFIKVGLSLSNIQLERKIRTRVKNMFNTGLLNEIKSLKKKGVTQKRLTELGFEYNNPNEEKIVIETLKYAKRQMTWFKRDAEIKWFKPSEQMQILKYIKEKY